MTLTLLFILFTLIVFTVQTCFVCYTPQGQYINIHSIYWPCRAGMEYIALVSLLFRTRNGLQVVISVVV